MAAAYHGGHRRLAHGGIIGVKIIVKRIGGMAAWRRAWRGSVASAMAAIS